MDRIRKGIIVFGMLGLMSCGDNGGDVNDAMTQAADSIVAEAFERLVGGDTAFVGRVMDRVVAAWDTMPQHVPYMERVELFEQTLSDLNNIAPTRTVWADTLIHYLLHRTFELRMNDGLLVFGKAMADTIIWQPEGKGVYSHIRYFTQPRVVAWWEILDLSADGDSTYFVHDLPIRWSAIPGAYESVAPGAE